MWTQRVLYYVAMALMCILPAAEAQKYCASGSVTSILSCNGCSFHVGDPVAMTFAVVANSVTCVGAPAQGNGGCLANAVFSMNVGSNYWTDASLNAGGGPTGGVVSITASTLPALLGGTSSSAVSLIGIASGSAVPGGLATASLQFSTQGNLVSSGALPSSLPDPSQVPTQSVFASINAGANPFFSYTGNNCAAAPAAAPTINANGVVTINGKTPTIEPGSWASIYGLNLAPGPATWNGDFPTSLGGTSVTVNAKPAYLWFVSPTQINFQAPDDTTIGPVSVVVATGAGSVTSTVTLGQFAPSFSLLDVSHVAGIISRANGAYDIIGPTGSSLGYPTVAAKAGDSVILFGTGFGPTTPAVPAGKVYSGAAATANPVSLTINGKAVTPSFAGITEAGLYQINLTIPAGAGTGDVPLSAIVGAVNTPAGVVISLQ